MCCCGQPIINGPPGYKWQPNDPPSVRPVNPPEIAEGDTLLYDEPGRCGGLDCHSHHFRLVRDQHRIYTYLLVRHGGGTERIKLDCSADCLLGTTRRAGVDHLASLDSNGRYWLLHTIYSAHRAAGLTAQERTSNKWAQAFIDKRIKKRKRSGVVRVDIEPESTPAV